MEIKERVAWNLRRLRVAKGISQDELAMIAGLERAYVGHLERGGKNPTIVTLEKLATALECGETEFLQQPPEGAVAMEPLKGGRKAK
jgi:transcriptional regulator with XRE-family HTH domain